MTANTGSLRVACTCGGDQFDQQCSIWFYYDPVTGDLVNVNGRSFHCDNPCTAPIEGHVENPSGEVVFDGLVPPGTFSMNAAQLAQQGMTTRDDFRNLWIRPA